MVGGVLMKISFNSKGDFGNVHSWLKDVNKRNPSSVINKIADQGTRSLEDNTPKNTGETALGWVSEVTTRGGISEVAWKNKAHPESQVNVAKLIELGHGTATGGYVPPKPYIKNSMAPVWKDIDKALKELIKE